MCDPRHSRCHARWSSVSHMDEQAASSPHARKGRGGDGASSTAIFCARALCNESRGVTRGCGGRSIPYFGVYSWCTVNVLSSGCGVRYFGMYSIVLCDVLCRVLCTSKCAMHSVGNGVYSHDPSRVHCTLSVLGVYFRSTPWST